jgi:hypothetical protein
LDGRCRAPPTLVPPAPPLARPPRPWSLVVFSFVQYLFFLKQKGKPFNNYFSLFFCCCYSKGMLLLFLSKGGMNDHQSQSNQQFSQTFGVLTTGLRLWKPWYQWMLKRRSIRNFINLFGCYFLFFFNDFFNLERNVFLFLFSRLCAPQVYNGMNGPCSYRSHTKFTTYNFFCFSLTKGCLCTGRVYVVKKKYSAFSFSLFNLQEYNE